MEEVDFRWRKASFSDNGGNCVEVGQRPGTILVRDTKHRAGAVLRFDPDAWRRFAEQVKRSLALDLLRGVRRGGILVSRMPPRRVSGARLDRPLVARSRGRRFIW